MRVTEYSMSLDDNQKPYLVKERGFLYGDSSTKVNSPTTIDQFMRKVFKLDHKANEYVYLLAMNSNGQVIGVMQISQGTINTSLFPPREIILSALLMGAAYIILVHNHPSGNTNPSSEDIKSTERLRDACDLVGVPIKDHIIIGNNYYSFMGNGAL